MSPDPSRPRLRAIRGKRFGEPPRRPKKPDVFAKPEAATKSRSTRLATKPKKPSKSQVVEPPGALLHLALAKDGHHREWFIGILGKEWEYTAIYEIDYFPHIYAHMTLAEAQGWVIEYLQLIAESRKAGYADADLRHCGWSGLKEPTQRVVPREVG